MKNDLRPNYQGTTITSINKVGGLLRLGVIVGFEPSTLTVSVYMGGIKEYTPSHQDTSSDVVKAQLPLNYFAVGRHPPKSGFAGGYPENGTPVIIAQGETGVWYIVTMLAKDPSARNTTLPPLPSLEPGTYIIQYGDTFLRINQNDGLIMGENKNNIALDVKRDIFCDTFDNRYLFSEASRTIEGIIRRDVRPNENYAPSLRETNLAYNDTLKVIPMDPTAAESWSNVGSTRNPLRAEKREIIYEFGRSFDVLSDDKEFLSYKDNKNIRITDVVNRNRRESRVDTLSLSLVAPNYLMETIKGTVVDIYGNLLDLNRSILPIGKEKYSINKVKHNLVETDALGNIFKNIKTLARRELAYHFELNVKKDLSGPPDVTKNDDFARNRSRFFFDIDKEGQFKLNVPASSEQGNIPLLTRYENFSTVSPNEKTQDPNDLVFNQNSQDILIESFIGNNGAIKIVDDKNIETAPIDRFSNSTHITHGTAYHDISLTCRSFRDNTAVGASEFVKITSFALGRVSDKKDIVTPVITTAGTKANAGGRSGSLNFDGSIEVNIGANTVDRQSLWVDLQGGMIGNFGRDLNNDISAALNFDGEVLIQSGGATGDNDSRFKKSTINNNNKSGVIDLRVRTKSGAINVIRIDDEGVTIHSEGRIAFYSSGDMMFSTPSKFTIDSENIVIGNRRVIREEGLGVL